MLLRTCISTVRGLRNSWPPISRLVLPAATSRMTSVLPATSTVRRGSSARSRTAGVRQFPMAAKSSARSAARKRWPISLLVVIAVCPPSGSSGPTVGRQPAAGIPQNYGIAPAFPRHGPAPPCWPGATVLAGRHRAGRGKGSLHHPASRGGVARASPGCFRRSDAVKLPARSFAAPYDEGPVLTTETGCAGDARGSARQQTSRACRRPEDRVWILWKSSRRAIRSVASSACGLAC